MESIWAERGGGRARPRAGAWRAVIAAAVTAGSAGFGTLPALAPAAAGEAGAEASRPVILFKACDDTRYDPGHGCELWVTDLTEAGTRLVRDIAPGGGSSGIEAIHPFAEGLGLFVADDGSTGREFWISDGTPAGTRRLADIFPGGGGSAPSELTPLGDGRALFAATVSASYPKGADRELWITDGTEAGTRLVKDIAPDGWGSMPAFLVPLSPGRVIFAALAPCGSGWCRDLWVSDGTEAGTQPVRATAATPFSVEPKYLFPLGDGRVLFAGMTPETGIELWITDGTRRGTRLVRDLEPGVGHSWPDRFAALGGGRAVFAAQTGRGGRELWVTDGTRAGTFRVRDIRPGEASAAPDHLTPITPGRVVFTAETDAAGRELWITDGTRTGTRLVRDIYPGASGGVRRTPWFAPLGEGRFAFVAETPAEGQELWVTDGTRAGTRLGAAIQPGAVGGEPAFITAVGDGRVVFTASSGFPKRTEPFVSNGRAAGTRMIADVNPCENCSSYPSAFARIR